MKKRIDQLKIIFNDVLYVSKQTGTTNKKLTIFLAILTSNLTVFLDIIIISVIDACHIHFILVSSFHLIIKSSHSYISNKV